MTNQLLGTAMSRSHLAMLLLLLSTIAVTAAADEQPHTSQKGRR